MSTDRNRDTALRMVATLGGGRPDPAFCTEDVVWWIPGRGSFGMAEFLSFAGGFTAFLKGGRSALTVLGVTADGDRVAIEAESHGEFTNGTLYNNTYHYLFVFRNGRICEAKLYNDTKYVADLQAALTA